MQSRRNLIKIIKARKKQDHKYILHHANILLSKCFERLEELKQYDVVSGIADFKDTEEGYILECLNCKYVEVYREDVDTGKVVEDYAGYEHYYNNEQAKG